MAYLLQSGIHVSLDNSTWYKLTDHNRSEIEISPEVIESQARMANGKMRKYVVAVKNNISTSWEYVPSRTYVLQDDLVTKEYLTVDGNYAAGWLESFYNANVGVPIYLKIISSEYDTLPTIGNVPNEANRNFKTSAQLKSLSTSSYTTVQETSAKEAQELGSTENFKTGTGFKVYNVFMSNFNKTIINRTKVSDYVNMSIEFTEI